MARIWAIAVIKEQGPEVVAPLGTFTRPRRPRLEKNDTVLLFDRFHEDIVFWARGTVIAVPDVIKDYSDEDEGRERRGYQVTLKVMEVFESVRSLDDLRFSLQRVWRFKASARHFRGRYSRLTAHDAEVILTNQIAWARTAVGLLANCLPMSERVEMAEEWVQKREPERSYQGIAKGIIQLIGKRYVSAVELLQAVSKLDKTLEIEGAGAGVRFVDGGQVINLGELVEEARPIGNAFSAEKPNAFERMLSDELSTSQEFRHAFRISNDELLRLLMVTS
jgi:hypothetical protein